MSKLFRSIESYESIHSNDVLNIFQHILPSDARMESVGRGHQVVIVTADESFVLMFNLRIADRARLQREKMVARGFELNEIPWANGAVRESLTPQREITLSGFVA